MKTYDLWCDEDKQIAVASPLWEGVKPVLIRDIAEALPQGSGIDCKWQVNQRSKNVFMFSNSFHKMDKNGFYCGYADFSVVLSMVQKKERHALWGPYEGKFQVTARKGWWRTKVTGLRDGDLRDCIDERVRCALQEFGFDSIGQGYEDKDGNPVGDGK